jgi:hypothetical protein
MEFAFEELVGSRALLTGHPRLRAFQGKSLAVDRIRGRVDDGHTAGAQLAFHAIAAAYQLRRAISASAGERIRARAIVICHASF